GITGQRAYGAGPRIQDCDRAADLSPPAGPAVDPVRQRLLGDRLQTPVDVEHQAVSRNRRLGRQLDAGNDLTLRVDDDALPSRLAAQVAIVFGLDAVLADDVVHRIALRTQPAVFVRRNLPHVSENGRAPAAVRIVADGLRLDVDAGKIVQDLGQAADLGDGEVVGQDHGPVRFVRA